MGKLLILVSLAAALAGAPCLAARVENTFLIKAEAALQAGNLPSAQSLFARAQALTPGDPALATFAANLAEAVGKAVAASLREGEFYLSSGQLPRAQTAFRAVLVLDPGNKVALARAEEIKKNLLKLEQFQKMGIQVDPATGRNYDPESYSTVLRMSQAREAFRKGDFTTALRLVEAILAREPRYGEANRLREEIYQATLYKSLADNAEQAVAAGKLEGVLDDLGKLMAMRPTDGNLYLWRGKLLVSGKRFEGGKADLLEAWRLGVSFAEVRFPLCQAFAGLGQYQNAHALGSGQPGLPAVADPTLLRTWYWNLTFADTDFMAAEC